MSAHMVACLLTYLLVHFLACLIAVPPAACGPEQPATSPTRLDRLSTPSFPAQTPTLTAFKAHVPGCSAPSSPSSNPPPFLHMIFHPCPPPQDPPPHTTPRPHRPGSRVWQVHGPLVREVAPFQHIVHEPVQHAADLAPVALLQASRGRGRAWAHGDTAAYVQQSPMLEPCSGPRRASWHATECVR